MDHLNEPNAKQGTMQSFFLRSQLKNGTLIATAQESAIEGTGTEGEYYANLATEMAANCLFLTSLIVNCNI